MTTQHSVNGSVMVTGGGVSGIKAALDLAESGFYQEFKEPPAHFAATT